MTLVLLRAAEQTYLDLPARPDLLQRVDATGPVGSTSALGYQLHPMGTVPGARAMIQPRQQNFAALRRETETALRDAPA